MAKRRTQRCAVGETVLRRSLIRFIGERISQGSAATRYRREPSMSSEPALMAIVGVHGGVTLPLRATPLFGRVREFWREVVHSGSQD